MAKKNKKQTTTDPTVEGYMCMLYDTLMEEIEPDLTIKNVQTLDEKYADETPEQTKQRFELYAQAFALFLEVWEGYTEQVFAGVEQMYKDILTRAKAQASTEDAKALEQLEKQFTDSPPSGNGK